MKTSLVLLISAGALAAAYWVGDDRRDTGESPGPAPRVGVVHNESAAADFGVGYSLYLHGDGNYGRVITLQEDPNNLIVETRERSPSTLEEERYTAKYGVPLVPARLASLWTVDDFALIGFSRQNELVVEGWHLAPIDGGYHSERPFATTPIGTPAPYASTSFSIEGTFLSARERGGWPVAERTEIYRGFLLSEVDFAAGDPEGRFVLAGSAADGLLVQIDLQNEDTASILYDAAQLPLLGAPAHLDIVQHPANGRGFLLYAQDFGTSAVLWDADNDGYADSTEQYAGMPTDQAWYAELEEIL